MTHLIEPSTKPPKSASESPSEPPIEATPNPSLALPEVSHPLRGSHRWLWLLLITAAVIGIGAGLWYFFFRTKAAPMIQFSGRIEGYETDISTKAPGRIEAITVREGAAVKKGQILVRLSDEEVQSELRAATGQVEAAKQKEASARLQIAVLKSQLTNARLGLQQSEGDTLGKVSEAEALVKTAQAFLKQEQARVQEAEALLQQARVDRDRYGQLFAAGAETGQRYDLAKNAFTAAQASVQSRKAAVEGSRQAITIAQGKLTQARTTGLNPSRQQTNLSQIDVQIEQAQRKIAEAQADVKTAVANQKLFQARLKNLTVYSPMNGIVTVRSVEPGTVILPTRSLLRIVDLNQVYMRGFIPEGEIGKIRVGQAAKVYLDSDLKHQNPLKAKIASVDAKASFTPENVYFQNDRVEQVVGVKLAIEKPDRFAKPGMPADAEIALP
ncbi:MAG: efflux RND transporter periplasmic adaptor subunit [Thermosynechococcaceae cyanobacterium MS004]|nr:efflux RND transporter periplasmic adaptor subunit [Thermosynechococcaceae cyanobacterium MS004]